MTMVQEATRIMENMPRKNQQVFLDLLRMMNQETTASESAEKALEFKRSGKTNFQLPEDFDEHFDDLNDEIAALFTGESA